MVFLMKMIQRQFISDWISLIDAADLPVLHPGGSQSNAILNLVGAFPLKLIVSQARGANEHFFDAPGS